MEIVDFLNHIKDWQENIILKDLHTLIDSFCKFYVWMVILAESHPLCPKQEFI